MINKVVNWPKIFMKAADSAEEKFGLSVYIESAVIEEIGQQVEKTLRNYSQPNSAKIAGAVAFWVRKLKPLTIAPNSTYAFSAINEYISVVIGLGICGQYFDDSKKPGDIPVNPRVMKDLIYSFRYHSHSPHGSMMIFEVLTCGN
jgi:hypothetical protein